MYWSEILSNPEIVTSKRSKDFLDINCDNCNGVVSRSVKNLKQEISFGQKNKFCSRKCQGEFNDKGFNKCKSCGTQTKNRLYCSQSCSARDTNIGKVMSDKTRNIKSYKRKRWVIYIVI